MFTAQLKNELWKLFGKKRTYIGFGAFLLAQTAMLLAFKYTHWQSDFEKLLSGNGYLATEFISALTVSLVMLIARRVRIPIRLSAVMALAGSMARHSNRIERSGSPAFSVSGR